MARGEDCIQAGDQWFTPAGFEEFGGKESCRKWKSSIRCNGTALEKLFQGGHLTAPIFKRRKLCLPFNPSRSFVWRFGNEEFDALSEKGGESGSRDALWVSDEEEEAEEEQETGPRKRKTSKGNESCEEEKPRTSTQTMPIMMNVPKPVFTTWEGNDEEEEAEQENEEEERGEQSTPASPGRSIPGRSSPGRSTPGRSSPGRCSPGRSTPGRSSPGRSSPGRSSPIRSLVVPRKTVFQVTCGVISGMLHKQRFASGTHGKCIRTEQSWKTPIEFLSEGSNMTEASWKKDILWDGKPLRVLIENKFLEIHTLFCKCKYCKPTAKNLQDQENDDDCFICRSPGSLISCDKCPRSFHQGCHLPNVDDAMRRNDLPWVCTFCVLRQSQSWRYPSQNTYQEVLNYQTSKRRLECQYLLLYLYHADEDHIFVKDPCINGRKYSSVIKTPMWLDEVARKLQDGQYQTMKPFVSDLLLIFTNCVTFNRDNAKTAKRLKDVFKRELKQVFSF